MMSCVPVRPGSGLQEVWQYISGRERSRDVLTWQIAVLALAQRLAVHTDTQQALVINDLFDLSRQQKQTVVTLSVLLPHATPAYSHAIIIVVALRSILPLKQTTSRQSCRQSSSISRSIRGTEPHLDGDAAIGQQDSPPCLHIPAELLVAEADKGATCGAT
jgi:CRP-like cAMP-binding protein